MYVGNVCIVYCGNLQIFVIKTFTTTILWYKVILGQGVISHKCTKKIKQNKISLILIKFHIKI